MKKIVYAILGILLILPFAVKADMSGPLIREYEFEITNPNGAQLYDYEEEGEDYVLKPKDGNVPFGTRFTVSDDYDGDEYIAVSIYDEDTDESIYEGYINKKDGRSIVKDFKITEKELGEKINIIALDDLEIKKGPSYGYAGTGTIIKKDTKLVARPILSIYDEESGEYTEDEDDPWLYVEYNKTKGYIIAYDGTVGFDMGKVNGITSSKINMYHKYNDEKPFMTIPANTKISSQTYSLDMWAGSYYIEYNGNKGIVYDDEYIVENDPIEYTIVKDLKVYEDLAMDDNNQVIGKVVGTIPAGTKGSSKYWNSENWADIIRYESGDIKGWIYVPTYVDDNDEYDESEYIEIDYPWNDDEEEYDDELIYDSEDSQEDEQQEEETTSQATPGGIILDRQKRTKEIIYLCIGGAVISCLTAVVIILLINRRSKKKEENSDLETEKVEESNKQSNNEEKK